MDIVATFGESVIVGIWAAWFYVIITPGVVPKANIFMVGILVFFMTYYLHVAGVEHD